MIEKSKKALFAVIGVCLSCLLTLIFLEIVLFFFPVNEGLRVLPVNRENPVFKFTPNRESQFSKNWNFDIKNKVRINNDGFVNDINYDEFSKNKLLSIIGDSYVEALMVPFKRSVTGLLQSSTDNRVYSFAASGAGLSQHLVWAKYAEKKFNSDYFVFVIIANDFAESLKSYESSPGFHRFKRLNDNDWDLELAAYEPSYIRKFLRNSNLAMYLITNVKIHNILNFNLKLGKNDYRETYISNFKSEFSADFWDDATWATNVYLDNIDYFSNTKKKNILFVIDGIRQSIYDNRVKKDSQSFWYKIREYFIKEAKLRGFQVLDMHKIFEKEYKKNMKKFNFKTDSHWNELGHSLVAKGIKDTPLWKAFKIE